MNHPSELGRSRAVTQIGMLMACTKMYASIMRAVAERKAMSEVWEGDARERVVVWICVPPMGNMLADEAPRRQERRRSTVDGLSLCHMWLFGDQHTDVGS